MLVTSQTSAQLLLWKYVLYITNQIGRQFITSNFDNFDLIYIMNNSNFKNVVKLARRKTDIAKVKLILNEVYPNQNYDILDPFHRGTHGYENGNKMLDEACEIIVRKYPY